MNIGTLIGGEVDAEVTERVRQKFYALAGTPDTRRLKYRGYPHRRGRQGVSVHFLMAAFFIDAGNNWGGLASDLQEEIRAWCRVDESVWPVVIGLI